MHARIKAIQKENGNLIDVALGKGTEFAKCGKKPSLFIETTIIRIRPVEVFFEEEIKEKEQEAIIKPEEKTDNKQCCCIM